MEEKRIKFLTDNLDSTEAVRIDPVMNIANLGDFCKSHLGTIQNGKLFVKGIAEYRVDKVMEFLNSSNSETKQTSL